MALSMSSASALALLPWRAIGFGKMISFNNIVRHNTPRSYFLGVFFCVFHENNDMCFMRITMTILWRVGRKSNIISASLETVCLVLLMKVFYIYFMMQE